MTDLLRTMLLGKIHRATVTGADVNYVGSVTIDRTLLDAANILDGQQVDVVNVTTGARLTTYTIEAEAGSGTVQLNGAAAHLVTPGDIVIIICYAQVTDSQAHELTPSVVLVDENNRIIHRGTDPGDVPSALDNATAGADRLRSGRN